MLSHITIIAAMRCDLKCAHCLRGFPKERPDFPMDLLDKLLTEALPFGAKHVAIILSRTASGQNRTCA
jgi:MoaA/NifB/PqqE/SkfB family radical SAM enzyme